MAKTHIRDGLASIALSVASGELPPEVVENTKTIILDTLACAFGGLTESTTHAVHRLIRASGGNPQATVIGSTERTSCLHATFANGTALRCLDTNDYYFGRDPAHASGNLAPVLAVGEMAGASGADAIAALVAAYEIQFRLCDHAGAPSLWDRGWHHATNMSIASAAASAKLLGLNADKTAEAISIAATHGNVLTESMRGKMASIKATIEAVAAKGGVEAALMAQENFTGPETVFEGDYGWARVVAGELDWESLTAPLDGHYKIMNARIKPYPAFAPSQGLIQAALEIRHQHRPKPDDIASIEGRFPEQIFKWPTADDQKALPTNREMADHSPPYLIAVALIDGACGPEQFTAERINDPAVHDLIRKTKMLPDSHMATYYKRATGASVTLVMNDGRKLTSLCAIPPGHPENRLSTKQLETKLRNYAEPLIGSLRTGDILEMVAGLDKAPSLAPLMQLLAFETERSP